MKDNIHNFLGCDSSYEQADIVLLGVPFDGTTSFRPGARFGPSAIRSESFGLETYSPYADKDLCELRVFDGGDLELPFGNAQKMLDITRTATEKVLTDGKTPFLLGGEHLITLGAVQAVAKHYPQLQVLHFDAHTDLRDEYLGETLTHSGVIKQIWHLLGDGKIHQFGIRSGEKHEFTFAQKHTHLHKFTLDGFEETLQNLRGVPVYVTLDLDVLDPSCFWGTGTPEAGGVRFTELLNAILRLHELHVVGCDINELAPHYDQSGASTAVACKLTREILLQLKGD